MDHDVSLLAEQHAEVAHGSCREHRLLRERAVAAGGDVLDWPAREEAVRAVAVDDGGNAAARLGSGAKHGDMGIQACAHGS